MENRERIEIEDEPGIFAFERPDDPNDFTEDEWDEYRNDVITALNEVLKDFEKIRVHPSMLTNFDPFDTQAQKDSLSILLIRKGFITQREHDCVYFELMLNRAQIMRRDHLPEIRRKQIAADMNGGQHGGLFGPDGKLLD